MPMKPASFGAVMSGVVKVLRRLMFPFCTVVQKASRARPQVVYTLECLAGLGHHCLL